MQAGKGHVAIDKLLKCLYGQYLLCGKVDPYGDQFNFEVSDIILCLPFLGWYMYCTRMIAGGRRSYKFMQGGMFAELPIIERIGVIVAGYYEGFIEAIGEGWIIGQIE